MAHTKSTFREMEILHYLFRVFSSYRDGFPISLFEEAVQLKAAISEAKRRNLDPQFEPGVRNIVRSMVTKMSFIEDFQELAQVTRSYSLMRRLPSPAEAELERESNKMNSVLLRLNSNREFKKFYKALQGQGICELPFLQD